MPKDKDLEREFQKVQRLFGLEGRISNLEEENRVLRARLRDCESPDDAVAHFNLGHVLFRKDDWDEILEKKLRAPSTNKNLDVVDKQGHQEARTIKKRAKQIRSYKPPIKQSIKPPILAQIFNGVQNQATLKSNIANAREQSLKLARKYGKNVKRESRRSLLYASIASAQALAGEIRKAKRTISPALKAVKNINDPFWQSIAYARISSALAEAGDNKRAEKTVDMARKAGEGIIQIADSLSLDSFERPKYQPMKMQIIGEIAEAQEKIDLRHSYDGWDAFKKKLPYHWTNPSWYEKDFKKSEKLALEVLTYAKEGDRENAWSTLQSVIEAVDKTHGEIYVSLLSSWIAQVCTEFGMYTTAKQATQRILAGRGRLDAYFMIAAAEMRARKYTDAAKTLHVAFEEEETIINDHWEFYSKAEAYANIARLSSLLLKKVK